MGPMDPRAHDVHEGNGSPIQKHFLEYYMLTETETEQRTSEKPVEPSGEAKLE